MNVITENNYLFGYGKLGSLCCGMKAARFSEFVNQPEMDFALTE